MSAAVVVAKPNWLQRAITRVFYPLLNVKSAIQRSTLGSGGGGERLKSFVRLEFQNVAL